MVQGSVPNDSKPVLMNALGQSQPFTYVQMNNQLMVDFTSAPNGVYFLQLDGRS